MTANDDNSILQIEDGGRIRRLTLNRPDALNSFNDAMYDAVRIALESAAEDPNVAVVVITGNGRAFSSGQDLAEMAGPPQHDDGQRHGFLPFIEAVESFPKPLIAAVNGIAVGIGLTLLPHCDLVLVTEKARLRAPFVSLGVTAEAGSTALLPAMIGWQATARLLYTAGWVEGPEAAEMGLAWRCVPDDTLLDETMAIATQMAAMPIDSLVATKQLLLESRLDAVRTARRRELEVFMPMVGKPANLEALKAFAEKRPPDFTKIPASPTKPR